jgi:hypothetical protein
MKPSGSREQRQHGAKSMEHRAKAEASKGHGAKGFKLYALSSMRYAQQPLCALCSLLRS